MASISSLLVPKRALKAFVRIADQRQRPNGGQRHRRVAPVPGPWVRPSVQGPRAGVFFVSVDSSKRKTILSIVDVSGSRSLEKARLRKGNRSEMHELENDDTGLRNESKVQKPFEHFSLTFYTGPIPYQKCISHCELGRPRLLTDLPVIFQYTIQDAKRLLASSRFGIGQLQPGRWTGTTTY